MCVYIYIYIYTLLSLLATEFATDHCKRATGIYILQRGVQWKQGVVVYIII